MRVFLAIEFPEVIKSPYRDALPEFRRRFPELRWVQPECLHLTLRFLGEIADEEAITLEEPVRTIARNETPFSFSLGLAGAFGPPVSPRTFWLSVDEGGKALTRLQPRLEQLVQDRGFRPDDKRWAPHATLARRRQKRASRSSPGTPPATLAAWKEAAAAAGLVGLGFEVGEIALLSSLLRPTGPVYSPVWRVALGE